MSSNNHNKDKIESKNQIKIGEDDEEKQNLLKVEPMQSMDFKHRNSKGDDDEIVVEVSKNTLVIPSKNQRSVAKQSFNQQMRRIFIPSEDRVQACKYNFKPPVS